MLLGRVIMHVQNVEISGDMLEMSAPRVRGPPPTSDGVLIRISVEPGSDVISPGTPGGPEQSSSL